jgi:DNA modification methylase
VHAHVLDGIDVIPSNSVQMVITSPPYWGMRRYDLGLPATWPDKLEVPFGAEPKPEQYVERTKQILALLKDKLKDDGTIWWNLRDTYFTRAILRDSSSERLAAFEGRLNRKWKDAPLKRTSSGHVYLKDKDLTLIPFWVAYEAQKMGFWVRSFITWEKETVAPEKNIDRPALSHEYIIMLTKSRFYKWNSDDAVETVINGNGATERQLRSVWKMKPSYGRNGHPAPFSEKLVQKCIELSSNEHDIVLDPFVGSGTTAVVAYKIKRKFIGIDLVKRYLNGAQKDLQKKFPKLNISITRISHKKK